MQFRCIASTREARERGLEPFTLEPLGRVVAFFGANGAGKSRVLQVARERMQFLLHGLRTLDSELKLMTKNVEKSRSQREPREQVSRLQAMLDDLHVLRDDPGHFFSVPPNSDACMFDLTNPNGPMHDVQSKVIAQRDECLNDNHVLDGGHWRNVGPLSGRITDLFESIAVCHERQSAGLVCDARGTQFAALFDPARRLIGELMSMEFGFLPKGSAVVPSLNGRVWSPGEFSGGQKHLLFYVACILQALAREEYGVKSDVRFKGSVIVIDEPETSLHPRATKELVDALRRLVGEEGQLWVATHSLALFSVLPPEAIWLVQDGRVLPQSRIASTKAMQLLVGPAEDIRRLGETAEEPSRAMARQFLSECILEPQAVMHRHDDPQLANILSAINEAHALEKHVIVLDVGAGTGRLARELREQAASNSTTRIEYVAVECNKSLHGEIARSAGQLMLASPIPESVSEVPSFVRGRVHVAVLCNVLHEVPPGEWIDLLNGVQDTLRTNGVLLLCEDAEMSIGELPHKGGYLVLDSDEVQILFDLAAPPAVIQHPDPDYRGRLQCFGIAPPGRPVTAESVRGAIDHARGRLHDRVSRMRSGTEAPKDGRDFARASMMYLNSQFAIEELEKAG